MVRGEFVFNVHCTHCVHSAHIFLSQDTDLGSPEECSAGVAGDGPVVSPSLGSLQVTHLAPRAHDDQMVSSILFNE